MGQTLKSIPKLIVTSAVKVAKTSNTVGWCYKGVCTALRPLGIELTGDAAWMAKDQLRSDGRFRVVSVSNLQPGDILVHGKSKLHPYGHIAVYVGNNQEASDHIQDLIVGSNYGSMIVFRYQGLRV